METTQTTEVPISPLSRDILSAATRVRVAAEQGRKRVASKLREAKIGVLGLTVGSAFFLAACAGEAKPPDFNFSASLPPTTPVSEMQAPSGEPLPFELATEPTEKELFQQNIDTLISTVRGFFHEDYFKRMGYDLDKIADNLKNPDNTTDTTRLVSPRNNIQNVDTDRIVDMYNYPRFKFKEELPFHISFERDTETGEITKRRVAFYVDKNGKLLTYRENFPYAPQTKEDFDKLFDRLSDIVRVPEDNSRGATLKDLDWQTLPRTPESAELEDNAYAVIRGDKHDTVISLTGIRGNGLNLVSVSLNKHSSLTIKR